MRREDKRYIKQKTVLVSGNKTCSPTLRENTCAGGAVAPASLDAAKNTPVD